MIRIRLEGRTRDKCKMDLLASLCALARLAGLQGPAAIRVQHISREVQHKSPVNETDGFEPGDELLDKAACHRADVAGPLSATQNQTLADREH